MQQPMIASMTWPSRGTMRGVCHGNNPLCGPQWPQRHHTKGPNQLRPSCVCVPAGRAGFGVQLSSHGVNRRASFAVTLDRTHNVQTVAAVAVALFHIVGTRQIIVMVQPYPVHVVT